MERVVLAVSVVESIAAQEEAHHWMNHRNPATGGEREFHSKLMAHVEVGGLFLHLLDVVALFVPRAPSHRFTLVCRLHTVHVILNVW